MANDGSRRAQELRAKNEKVPEFDLTKASPELQAMLLANRERISVQRNFTAWTDILDRWRDEAPALRLSIKDHEPSTDLAWRVPVSDEFEVELSSTPWDATLQEVQWIALMPEHFRCNLTAERADEPGFAQGAPPRPRWRETVLPVTASVLSGSAL